MFFSSTLHFLKYGKTFGLHLKEIKRINLRNLVFISIKNNKFNLSELNNKSIPNTKNTDEEIDDLEKPIKYSTSPAASWKSEYIFLSSPSGVTPRLWYEKWVILGSLVVFMIYFFILREENDIDQRLSMSLTDHMHEIQKKNEMEGKHSVPLYTEETLKDWNKPK